MKIAAARQALVTAALLALPATGAAQSVQWYQYSVSTRYGDARFLAPIASCVASGGRCIEVERDLRRRLTRVTSYRDGKKVSEVHYSYSPGDTLPNAYEVVSANGTITEKDRLRRNARGQRISDSSFTVAGALTDYELRTYTDTSGEERDYSADGKETARYSYYYTGDVLTPRCGTPTTAPPTSRRSTPPPDSGSRAARS